MARKPAFKYTKAISGWKVEIPSRLSPTGDRQRAFFPTRDEAKEFAADLKKKYDANGKNAVTIKPSLAEEAVQAAELLKPFNVSLLEAARLVAASKTADLKSSVIEVAFEEFLRKKSHRSDVHLKAYRYMQRDLEKSFVGRTIASITAAELLKHVETHSSSDSSFNALTRLIGAFWRWCARYPREWCDTKVISAFERREVEKGETKVLNAVECLNLMRAAETHYPGCVAAFAICLFTGMRKAELARLRPADITKEGIQVPAVSAKTNVRRFIQMPKPLAAWLRAYPISERVLPGNWEKKQKAVRRLAGWKVWSDLVDPQKPPEDLPGWPRNALRHTHASVLVALGEPLEKLMFEFGHSDGPRVLKSHYVGVMPKVEARKIRKLRPKK